MSSDYTGTLGTITAATFSQAGASDALAANAMVREEFSGLGNITKWTPVRVAATPKFLTIPAKNHLSVLYRHERCTSFRRKGLCKTTSGCDDVTT